MISWQSSPLLNVRTDSCHVTAQPWHKVTLIHATSQHNHGTRSHCFMPRYSTTMAQGHTDSCHVTAQPWHKVTLLHATLQHNHGTRSHCFMPRYSTTMAQGHTDSCHVTAQPWHKVTLLHATLQHNHGKRSCFVSLCEAQGHSNWNQNVDFSHVYHHSQFERNRFTNVWTQNNLQHVLY